MKHELPQGYTWRVPTTDDAQSVTDLIVAIDVDELGEPLFDLQDLRADWTRKNFDLESDAWLVVAPDGSPAGYADMHFAGGLTRLNNGSGVHPAYKNRGIEDWILEMAEGWARGRVTNQPIVLRHVVNAHVSEKMQRMARWGYQPVRHAWLMRIMFDQPPPAPIVPEGIVLRAFERGRDEQAAHATIQETFRDLWQHQDVPYDEWANFVFRNEYWSPELSYLAYEGDEIAAAAIVYLYPNEGWVQQFGVRRPWRKRGLGLALLHTIFGEMYTRGLPCAGLEVDAQNPSGALRLYERAGMRVKHQYTEFRKVLTLNTRVPKGFTLRAPTPDDAQSVTDFVAVCDTVDYGEPDLSIEDIRADWRRDGFVLERDAWLVYAQDGTLVAYGNVYDTGEHARVEPTTCVHPTFREQGLEDFHIAHAEAWTRAYGDTKMLQWIVNSAQPCWTERFEKRGYHTTRHDYVMEIELNHEPPAPNLPDEFVIRSFERGRDERAVWACIQEAFRDHRGHKDIEFDAWWASYAEHAEWSPELSTVVTQGDEVVAAAMVFHSFAGGWVRQIGVRRPWRNQGIALAMLQRIFGECYARGIKKVGLGVDAQNLTGATRVYERAGMQVKVHFVRYEKEIT